MLLVLLESLHRAHPLLEWNVTKLMCCRSKVFDYIKLTTSNRKRRRGHNDGLSPTVFEEQHIKKPENTKKTSGLPSDG